MVGISHSLGPVSSRCRSSPPLASGTRQTRSAEGGTIFVYLLQQTTHARALCCWLATNSTPSEAATQHAKTFIRVQLLNGVEPGLFVAVQCAFCACGTTALHRHRIGSNCSHHARTLSCHSKSTSWPPSPVRCSAFDDLESMAPLQRACRCDDCNWRVIQRNVANTITPRPWGSHGSRCLCISLPAMRFSPWLVQRWSARIILPT